MAGLRCRAAKADRQGPPYPAIVVRSSALIRMSARTVPRLNSVMARAVLSLSKLRYLVVTPSTIALGAAYE